MPAEGRNPLRSETGMSLRIRVLIVDDHSVVAAALRAMLEAQPDMDVVGTVSDGLDAARVAGELKPDVVLMDVAMPGLNGIEATRRVHRLVPECRVVILSMHADTVHVQAAFKAGASGYILKRAAARDALAAIRAVRAGIRYLDPELAAELLGRWGDTGADDPLERLSVREREVLQLLAESHTASAIAAKFSLSPKTVETYRARLMEKLDIHDLAGLVRFAVRHGLIDP